MPCCCVPNCTTRGGIRMHQFPNDYERRIKWMKAVKRDDLIDRDWKKVRMSYRVCTLHFSEDHKFEDFENRTNLKKSAYPTSLLPDDNTTVVRRRRKEIKLSTEKSNPAAIRNVLETETKSEVDEEYVNFDDVCRSCLSFKNELRIIEDITFGDLSVQDVFEQYIGIKIDLQDNLPQHICTTCLYELCRVYLFINNTRETDNILKELIVNNNTENNQDIIILNSDADCNFSNSDEMEPLKVAEPGPPFVCNNCFESFDTLEEIKEHRTLHKHYIVRQYLCKFCNPSKVYTYRDWKNHVRVHTGEKPYVCHICGKQFSGYSNRERHVLIHTGAKPYSCNYCGKAYSQSNNLKIHKQREHPNLEVEAVNQFECTHCEKVFSTKCSLSHHLVVHNDKQFLCSECGKSFHYKSQLDRHRDTHENNRRHKCEICDKSFLKSTSLSLHKCTHTGFKPHECNSCGRRFSQKTHLVTHMKTHTGEKPYSCPYCHKTFALNGNLTVHIRRHTGEYPYVCDICSRGFADSSSMKNHRKKHDNERFC